MTFMTTIQFYHLLSTSLEMALPKLVATALKAQHRVAIRCADSAQRKRLSQALWEQDSASFLPHGEASEPHAAWQPILLTAGDDAPNYPDIEVIVDGRRISPAPTTHKLLDLFDGADEEAVANARTRWAEYKAQGYALQYIKQQPKGGWKIEMESPAASAA